MSQTLSIEVNSKWKQIKLNEPFALSIGIKDFGIEDPNENIISNSLSIPYEKNKAELKHVVDSNSKEGIKIKCNRLKAILSSNGLCREGFIYFDGYETALTGTCETVNLIGQFVSGVQDFLQNVPENLCDLPECFEPFTVNSQNIIDNWQDYDPYSGVPIYYGLTYQGGLLNETSVPVSYMQPQIYDAAIIEAIAKSSGYEIKSEYFKTEDFRRHLLTYGNECEFYSTVLKSESRIDIVIDDFAVLQFGSVTFPKDINIFFNIGNFQVSATNGGSLFLNRIGKYVMKAKFNSIGSGYLAIIETDTNQNLAIQEINDGYNEIDLSFELTQVKEIALVGFGDFTIPFDGATFFLCRNRIIENADLLPMRSLPCKKVKDYLLDLQLEHDLIFFFDDKNKCLLIETLYDKTLPTGEFIKGWYGSKSDAENWTKKIVKGSETGKFTSEQIKRTLITGYCQDDNDTLTNETYLDCETELCNKYEKGTTEKRMQCIGLMNNSRLPENLKPTIIVEPNMPIIPTEYEELEDGQEQQPNRYCSDKMKRLYKVGEKNGTWRFDGFSFDTYPYVTSLDTLLGINMSFCDIREIKGRMSIFYPMYIQQLNEKPQKSFRVKIDQKEISDLVGLYRKPKFIESSSGCYHCVLVSISNYTFEDCDLVEAVFLEI